MVCPRSLPFAERILLADPDGELRGGATTTWSSATDFGLLRADLSKRCYQRTPVARVKSAGSVKSIRKASLHGAGLGLISVNLADLCASIPARYPLSCVA